MSGTDLATFVAWLLMQHFWQGLVLAGALALTLRLARRSTSATRHAFCSMSLVALLALPLAVWLPLPRWSSAPLGAMDEQTVGDAGVSSASAATTGAPPGSASIPVSSDDRSTTIGGRSISGFLRSSAPFAAWVIFCTWLFGATWMLVRLGVHVARAERLRRGAVAWRGGPEVMSVGELGEVRTSSEVTCPLVVGLVQPTILLPLGFEKRCSSVDLGRVLAHEHAHVQRRDGWWHLLQRTAEALFFFHPGVRWIARRMEFEREAACDDRAAARTGGPAEYSESLLTVCETVQRRRRPVLAVGALTSTSQMTRRIENMLDNERDHRPRGSTGWIAVFAASCAALIVALALISPAPVSAAPGEAGRASSRFGELIGETPLIRAALEGDAAEVRRLLDAGADPNESARHEPRSPLYAAAVSGHVETLRVLLDRGAEVDRVVRGDATPLMAACRHGHLMAARLLVSRGADVNVELRGDGTPLIAAARGGNSEIVELLLDEGADVNAAVHGDGNPLIVASRRGHDEIVRLLVAAGANPDVEVRGDGSPMIHAAKSDDVGTVDALLSAGADPNLGVHGDGSPLIGAAASGNTTMVERLLLAGADPNRAVSGDGSPLISAARSGRLDTVRVLIDAGAEIDMPVIGDGNPLIAAAAAGNAEIVRYMIERGGDVDAIVPGDETPLINAAGGGHLEVARVLLDAGADPDLGVMVDEWRGGRSRTVRRSPLSAARRSGGDAMVRLLLQHGATD